MTIGIYIRVSTEEQAKEGYSIPAQKERLISFCASQGWDNYRFYIDEGVSAKDMNRPKLQLLLDHVKSGQIKILLVYRLDRFTRKVKDLHKMLEMLESHGCSFKSATEPYDTTTAMGKLFITIVAALAEWETDNLSERVKMALEEKVSGGEHVGGVPFGFTINEQEKKEPKEDEVAIVLTMIEKLKSGMSVNQIAKYLTRLHGKWHHNTILRILKNPVLYGATKWNDKVFENTHTGIISKTEWLKIQTMLEDNSFHHKREVVSHYLFQGVLACPRCKRPLTVNRYVRKRKDGSEYQGAVYKCQNRHKAGYNMLTVGEARFEDALYEYMKNVKIEHIVPPVKEKDELSVLNQQLQQIMRQREKFQRAWAAGKMTDEEFDKLSDETRPIMDELNKKIKEIKKPAPAITKEELEKTIYYFNENFQRLSQEEKSKFIAEFIRKIEFRLIPKPPKDKRNKKGKDIVEITHVVFY